MTEEQYNEGPVGNSPRYYYDEKLYLQEQFLAVKRKRRKWPEGFAGFPERPFEPVIVRVLAGADGRPTPHDGRWIVTWNAHTPCGVLSITTTDDPAKAKKFPHHGEAFRQWRSTSVTEPELPNGKLHRPLTAISIEILKEP